MKPHKSHKMVNDKPAKRKVRKQGAVLKMKNSDKSLKQKGVSTITAAVYTCTVCKKCFRSNLVYRKHLKLHIDKLQKPIPCPLCNKKFIIKQDFLNHMYVHAKTDMYRCPVCPKTFTHKNSLNQHLMFHSGKPMLSCKICSKEYDDEEDLIRHHAKHSNRPYECDVCNKSFNIKSSLQRHMNCHSGVKPFACDICKRGYTRRSVLMLHVKQVHQNMKPYNCPECGMSFSQKGNLRAHYKRKHIYRQKRIDMYSRERAPRIIKVKQEPIEMEDTLSIESSSNPELPEDALSQNDVDESPEYDSVEVKTEIDLDDEDIVKFFDMNNDLICNLDNDDHLPILQDPAAFPTENLPEDMKVFMSEFDMLIADPKGWENLLLSDPCESASFTNDFLCPPTKTDVELKQQLKDIYEQAGSPSFVDHSASETNQDVMGPVDGTQIPLACTEETVEEFIIPDEFLPLVNQIKIELD